MDRASCSLPRSSSANQIAHRFATGKPRLPRMPTCTRGPSRTPTPLRTACPPFVALAHSTCFHSAASPDNPRSEEHTSELQSLRHLVCRLLLEKKNNNKIKNKSS